MISLKPLSIVLVAGIMVCIVFGAQAQGFYGKLSGSYNLGIGSQNHSNRTIINTLNQADNIWQQTVKEERVKVNFGKGPAGNAAIGYLLTSGLGFELEASYLAGEKCKTAYQVIYNPDPDRSNASTTEMYARMVMFQPSLLIVTDLSDRLDLHGKFGIVAAKGSIYMQEHSSAGQGRGMTETEYTKGWGFGLQGALGLSYALNEKYALFSEIKMSNLSYTPKVVYLKKEIVNGNDVTVDPDKENSLEEYYSIMNNQRDAYLKKPFNFSSAGLAIGLKYNF